MAKGTTYNHERIARTDGATGRRVLQLTSFPSVSFEIGYPKGSFVRGGQSLVFISQRAAARGAPFDVFRVDLDGASLTQMTERDGISGLVAAWDCSAVWFTCEGIVWRLDPETLEEEQICSLEGAAPSVRVNAHMSHDGRYYFPKSATAAGEPILFRCATDGSEVKVLRRGEKDRLHCADARLELLCMIREERTGPIMLAADYDGVDERLIGPNIYAHSCLLHGTRRIQGCGLPPVRAVLSQGVGDPEPVPVCEGPYFWHSGSSHDGQWVVADTNWPNEGLYLVHVPSGRFALLCHPGASCGHPQWTHPHPFFTPDGSSVVYQSDATGVAQLYLIGIPDHLRRRLATGERWESPESRAARRNLARGRAVGYKV